MKPIAYLIWDVCFTCRNSLSLGGVGVKITNGDEVGPQPKIFHVVYNVLVGLTVIHGACRRPITTCNCDHYFSKAVIDIGALARRRR